MPSNYGYLQFDCCECYRLQKEPFNPRPNKEYGNCFLKAVNNKQKVTYFKQMIEQKNI